MQLTTNHSANFAVGAANAQSLVMKTTTKTATSILLLCAMFILGGCASDLASTDGSSTPATVDTSWVDDQRAADQQREAQRQQELANQQQWDAQQAASQQQQDQNTQMMIQQQQQNDQLQQQLNQQMVQQLQGQ